MRLGLGLDPCTARALHQADTGSGLPYPHARAQQYLTMAVYTIFKNLTIILIAYGELVWFGKSITPMTLVAFGLMVRAGSFIYRPCPDAY